MNIDFELNPTPQKLAILINNCTGDILAKTYSVEDEDLAGFGESLLSSAEDMESIFKGTEILGYTMSSTEQLLKEISGETIDYLAEPDGKKVYQMRDVAAELIKIKKSVSLSLKSKSEAALEIVRKIGFNNVTDYRERVLELNVILSQLIRARLTD
ncbi:MAG TPA: hypothetical protein DEG17_04425 [Cyanobacteria bacterium UBA11149]|nr:hypothetical protein [Cyanobacteria bacterium UBA11366]HBR77143.1 hypothetical protein [Cyanobacteria bacterium UBA11159]HBS71216.1 hypothetical protein [Cyanobacteria bacterium UBA11153]HBW88136.1 hypothetical protein [Cyanobacteria bacterium UBA11149]